MEILKSELSSESDDFRINYEKRKNSNLFQSFESEDFTFLSNVQNYVPIYKKFFLLNEANYNSINLNHYWFITDIKEKCEDNDKLYHCTLKNKETQKTKRCDVFFKMAPLLDPFKYFVGKYDITNANLFNLPKINSTDEEVDEKILDANNSAYIDGFFYFLSSSLIYKYNFIHGVDFYGSFLAIKNNFNINVIDDLDYLSDSDFFNKNNNVLFHIEDYNSLLNQEKVKPIKIQDNISNKLSLSIKSINNDIYDNIFENNDVSLVADSESYELTEENINSLIDITHTEMFKTTQCDKNASIKTKYTSSTCSSRTSRTIEDQLDNNNNESDADCNTNNEDDEYEDCDEDDSVSTVSEECINATIPKFPVDVICIESCENTFDSLILNDELSSEEWFSALMQIIMILIMYQNVFSFTHNDLHTNNVMYNTTEIKYLYYFYNNKYYKVPTFGRIFKIIDFGRSIYKYHGKIFCSDSFKKNGDASGQYNTEPYFNDSKPRIETNYSFDLTRLACSIFDYLVEDLDEIKDIDKCEPYVKLIVEWCLDDTGLNVIYKKNGDERYPDFKLYKMISRCVHKHTPHAQLERSEFNNFVIPKPYNIKVNNIIQIPNSNN